jgi:hypothetical protein
MVRHSPARFRFGLVILFAVAAAPPAYADFVVMVNDIEVLTIPGTLGFDQSRGLAPTDVRVSDMVMIQGLTVQSDNRGGTSGTIVMSFHSLDVVGPATVSVTIAKMYGVNPAGPLAAVRSQFEGLPLLTDAGQSGQVTERITANNHDLPDQVLQYKFGDAIISGSRPGGPDDTVPLEAFSLNFGKVQVEYQEQGPTGKLQQIQDFSYTLQWQAVPAPPSLALVGLGAAGLLGYRWRQRKQGR